MSRRTVASSPAIATRSSCQALPDGLEGPEIEPVSVLGGVTSGVPVSASTLPSGVSVVSVSVVSVVCVVSVVAVDVVSVDVVSVSVVSVSVVSVDVVSVVSVDVVSVVVV